jgi:glyoxylase-like metal-dependent hydrolase (beta-lactamase superfamily II)
VPGAVTTSEQSSGAGEPARWHRAAGVRSVWLGDHVRVSNVPDGVSPVSPAVLSAPTDYWQAHPKYLDADGYVVTSIGGLLVERGDRALLIDAGFGPRAGGGAPLIPPWRGGRLPESLRQVGRDPGRIEAVAFTHMHDDHIGWATPHGLINGKVLFGLAEWLVTGPEWEANRTDEHGAVRLAEADSRLRIIDDGEEVFPGVTAVLAPGHTRGHTGYLIDTGDARLLVLGDAVHTPAQVEHPEWTVIFDSDHGRAEASRRRLLDLATGTTTAYAGHFAGVQFGRPERNGNGPRWRPLPPEITGI